MGEACEQCRKTVASIFLELHDPWRWERRVVPKRRVTTNLRSFTPRRKPEILHVTFLVYSSGRKKLIGRSGVREGMMFNGP